MRILLLGLGVAIATSVAAQPVVKFNAASALVGVPQVGYERPLDSTRTLQFDLIVSPWRSVNGNPMQFAILLGEWRHHFREPGSGGYVGLHTGLTAFRFQKPDYVGTDFFQEGFGAVFGATLGWERRVGERWGIDAFVGGGTAQSKYKGYLLSTGDRYDGERGWNESGEWLPYRGGVMLTYRLR